MEEFKVWKEVNKLLSEDEDVFYSLSTEEKEMLSECWRNFLTEVLPLLPKFRT